jgi:hypothetical protein
VVLPAIVGLVAAVLLVVRLTAGPPGDHVRSAAQSLFVDPATSRPTAHVDSCDQIGSNPAARIYMCDVTAPDCSRYFQIAVFRKSFSALPVWAPAVALRHPCTPIHAG